MKIRWDTFVPQNYYELDEQSKDFGVNVREQIFHQNADFLTKPSKLLDEEDEMYKKFGLPSKKNILRFE